MQTEELETQHEEVEQLEPEAAPEAIEETEEEAPAEEEVEAPAYYTPEEMRSLTVDNIDTSKIPPEMQAFYHAMQAPITRKSQELAEKLKREQDLEQGSAPLQEKPKDQPSLNEVASQVALQNLGLQEKPEPWDDNYDAYVLEAADARREIKAKVETQAAGVREFEAFKAGFAPEQFQKIDQAAEDRMYQMLADPSTRKEGQRIMQAVQNGDTATVLAFVRETAKEVLKTAAPAAKKNPPSVEAPSGSHIQASKDPAKMTPAEYESWRNGQ